jgi:hypothetical protein
MKRTIANVILHLLIGVGSFVLFWMAGYGAEERGSWTEFWVVCTGCALAAFATGYLGRRFLGTEQPSRIPSFAFALPWALCAGISLVSPFAEGRLIWEPFAFWLTAAAGAFLLVCWGSFLRNRTHQSNAVRR